jgi:hypothetical protein
MLEGGRRDSISLAMKTQAPQNAKHREIKRSIPSHGMAWIVRRRRARD